MAAKKTVKETIGDTFEKANAIAAEALGDESLKNISLKIAKDEESYNKYVDADYRAQHDYEESKGSLPWLICSYERPNAEDVTPIDLKIKLQGSADYLTFGGTSSNVGTVSEDGKKLTVTAKKYVMFKVKNDLGVEQPTGNENFIATLENNGQSFTVDTLTPPTIKSTLPATVAAESEFDFSVTTVANDYVGETVKVKGTVTNKDLLTLKYQDSADNQYKEIPIDESGVFYFGPKAGYPLASAITNFKATIADGATVNVKLEIIKQSDMSVLGTPFEKDVVATDVNSNLTVTAGANCEGAKLTLNDKVSEFGVAKHYPVGSKVTVKVTKEGYVNYVQEVTIKENEDTEVTVDLEVQQFTVTVNAPEGATITVNDVPYTKPVVLDYGTKVVVKSSKENYVDFEQTIDSLTKDEVIDVDMVLKQFTLTVTTTPEDATVKLNGTELKQITVDYGTTVAIEVSKKGYKTVSEDFVVNADVTKEFILELEQYKFSVATNPVDATVKLNGTEQREITVDYGTTVNVEVSKTGYETITDAVVIEEETSKNYTLEKSKVNVTVKAKSVNLLKDAEIRVGNSVAQQDVPVVCTYGEPVVVTVTQTGYKPFETEITPTEDTEVLVNGDGEWRKPQVSVTTQIVTRAAVPGAVIKINGEVVGEGVAKDVDYNTEAVIEVTADGYVPFNETKLITADYACVANMVAEEAKTFKVTVEPTPADATVKINGSETKELVVEEGTVVDIEVSKEGYETYTKQITVTEDVTEVVNLVIKQFTLTVNTIPADATVMLNDVEQRQITVDYGSTVKVFVSKEGYIDKTDSVVVTEDKTIQIELESKEPQPEPGDFLAEATKIIEAKANYSYLNCSRFFKTDGITEETIKQFYQEFGYFVMSKIDYKLWRMMHAHFGHMDNIPEPEPESESEKPITSRHEPKE